jgi:hypothetical protein
LHSSHRGRVNEPLHGAAFVDGVDDALRAGDAALICGRQITTDYVSDIPADCKVRREI